MSAEFTAAEHSAMAAALEAARQGRRGANPLVGATVLGQDGQIVTGFHLGAGHPHAEVDAMTKAQSRGVDLSTSTILVTLEPCAHRGRTGPCTEAIIAAGIRDVVFALPDLNHTAAGGGTVLAEAGLRVRHGLGRTEAAALNERWREAVAAERPFVTAKIAQSLDGRATASDGTSQWITSLSSREHAHLLRAQVDAIVVGTGTAAIDNPRLSARTVTGELLDAQPLPVVIGRSSLPPQSHLARNPQTLHVRTRNVTAALQELYGQGIRHVLVEGGPRLLGSFFTADVVDEVVCYQAPTLLGPGRASVADLPVDTLTEAVHLVPDDTAIPAVSRLGTDVLLHFITAARPLSTTTQEA